MAAGGEEQAIGKRRDVGQPRGQRMRLQMIDRHQRLAVDQRNRLGGGRARRSPRRSGRGRPRRPRHRSRRSRSRLRPWPWRSCGPAPRHARARRFPAPRRQRRHARWSATARYRTGYMPRPSAAALDHGRRGLVARRLDSEYNHSGPGRNRMSPIWRHRRSIARSDGAIGQPAKARLRIGTRGSPLALAQASMVRACWLAAHGLDPAAIEIMHHPHQRRPHPGPPAGGGRRQGPVHQGDRGGLAGGRDRSRGAFGQGHADRFCRTD